jgi:PAS domain S-box-containing protein
MNWAAVDMLGYDYAEEVIGLPSYSLVASDDREEVMRRTAVRARGEVVADMYEVRRLRRNGGVVLCEANVSMIMYEGKPVSLSVDRDISERKKMKELRREAHGAPSRQSRRRVREQRSPELSPKEKTRRRDKNK